MVGESSRWGGCLEGSGHALLMDLCDEGDFLMLDATPWPLSPEAGRWLIYMGDDPETGPVGWTVSVDDHDVPLGVPVEVSVEVLDSAPPLPSSASDDVVEVSVMGGAVLSGGAEDLVVVPPTTAAHRLRVSRRPGRGASPTLLVQALAEWSGARRCGSGPRDGSRPGDT